MIVVISNREVGVAMSDLNQTVEFIKEIEKLKSVTRFNRTLDGRFENSAEHSWQGCDSCDGSSRLLSWKIEYGKGDFYVTDP